MPIVYNGNTYLVRDKTLQKTITCAANSGAQTIGTVSSGSGDSVLIESVTVRAVTPHANLTSITVTGGASSVVEFISVTTGAYANLDAADEQVAWVGAVSLPASGTIVATYAGTGAGSTTYIYTIKYRPSNSAQTGGLV